MKDKVPEATLDALEDADWGDEGDEIEMEMKNELEKEQTEVDLI